jgi:hypothetical protein
MTYISTAVISVFRCLRYDTGVISIDLVDYLIKAASEECFGVNNTRTCFFLFLQEMFEDTQGVIRRYPRGNMFLLY